MTLKNQKLIIKMILCATSILIIMGFDYSGILNSQVAGGLIAGILLTSLGQWLMDSSPYEEEFHIALRKNIEKDSEK